MAARNGYDEAVRLLLGRDIGAEVNVRDIYGHTPLSWAAESGCYSVIKIILEDNAQIDSMDNEVRTPLSWTRRNGDQAFGGLLRERDDGTFFCN